MWIDKVVWSKLWRTACGQTDTQTDTQTHRHTGTWTDKSLKTEGPKILSNDIFYFRTVIIGGPINISIVWSCVLEQVIFLASPHAYGSRYFPWGWGAVYLPFWESLMYIILLMRIGSINQEQIIIYKTTDDIISVMMSINRIEMKHKLVNSIYYSCHWCSKEFSWSQKKLEILLATAVHTAE